MPIAKLDISSPYTDVAAFDGSFSRPCADLIIPDGIPNVYATLGLILIIDTTSGAQIGQYYYLFQEDEDWTLKNPTGMTIIQSPAQPASTVTNTFGNIIW